MQHSFSLKSYIKLLGNERMNFEYSIHFNQSNLSSDQLLPNALVTLEEYFGFHYNGNLIGPFHKSMYVEENFVLCSGGFSDLLHFYHGLDPIYTRVYRNENPILLFDFLQVVVKSYQNINRAYHVFKYNYNNILETKSYPVEQFHIDFFYLFVFIENSQISIGRLWYD